jgi:hypothetical protein
MYVSSRAPRNWNKMSDQVFDSWLDSELAQDKRDVLESIGAPPDLAYGEDERPVPIGTIETAKAVLKRKFAPSKERAKIVAQKWQRILTQMGISGKVYELDDGKVVFMAERGFNDMIRIREYVLAQKETLEFEWKNEKYYPNVSRERELKRAWKRMKRQMRLERIEQEKKIKELEEYVNSISGDDVDDEMLNAVLRETRIDKAAEEKEFLVVEEKKKDIEGEKEEL